MFNNKRIEKLEYEVRLLKEMLDVQSVNKYNHVICAFNEKKFISHILEALIKHMGVAIQVKSEYYVPKEVTAVPIEKLGGKNK